MNGKGDEYKQKLIKNCIYPRQRQKLYVAVNYARKFHKTMT